MRIICVIPAYNEAGSIEKTVAEAARYSDEVIVVDDGSSDRTARLAKRAGALVMRHIINRGQGAALETGTRFALARQAEIIVHFDADGQMNARDIPKMIGPIEKGKADIVFGSRFLRKNSSIPPLKRYLILPLAHLVNRLLIGRTLSDPQAGFRAMNRRAAGLITIENDGAAHCSEIIYKAFKNRLRIAEAGVSVVYSDFGQGIIQGRGRGQGGIRIIKDLILMKIME